MIAEGPVASSVVAADVVVVGDGPAGSALAAALNRRGVDVELVGPGEAWTATYTTWADDLDGLALLDDVSVWAHRFDRIAVRFGRARDIERAYGVIDNDSLQAHLWRGLRRTVGTVDRADEVRARLVVDATGWPSKLGESSDGAGAARGWQTAFGVVLADPPPGPLGSPTMMDYSDPGRTIDGRESVPTFAYSLPVHGGWLVEETVLSASPAVKPDLLVPLLAARLRMSADDLLAVAVRTESVRIPMGAPVPSLDDDPPLVFGAAAGMIHPATGYSVGAALRAAQPVADAIASALDKQPGDGPIDTAAVRTVVWSDAARRTRHLHDYGHDVLLRLERRGVQRFFDTFFDLPVETWAPYMRIDTAPSELASVMMKMFATASMPLRARLVSGDPRRFLRMLRP